MLSDANINNKSEISAGEERVLKDLISALKNKTAAHAYIIEGSGGASRLRCAQTAACSAVCRNIGTDLLPCMKCNDCLKVISGEHTDIKIIYPEKESGKARAEIKVDTVRNLRKDAYIMPAECDWHIYIISESEKMNVNAQNALLKILEEPPENTVFFLLAPSKELLLPTVVSRAQCHTLGKSSTEEIYNIYKEKFPGITADTLKRAAKIQSLFDKIELDESEIKTVNSAYDTVRSFFSEKQPLTEEYLPQGKDELFTVICVMAAAARDIAVSKKDSGAELFIFENKKDFEKAKNNISLRRAIEIYEAFSRAAERLQTAGNVSSILAELFTSVRK